MQQNTLDSFINDMLEQKGFGEEADDVKEVMRKDLRKRLDDFIMARTIASFSEEDLKAFEQMLDEKKPLNELTQFTSDHIPDYPTFLAATLLEFEDVFLSVN